MLFEMLKPCLCILLFLSIAFVSYSPFISGDFYNWNCPVSQLSPPETRSVSAAATTNISHILFAIAGSARTWRSRRTYAELWWRPGVTRGHVWLDTALPPGADASSIGAFPPHLVSADASMYGRRAAAARIAQIVVEAYRRVAAPAEGKGETELRWLVMGDDDTVFFPENLAAVLARYDHREMYYVGGVSESVEQDVAHSYGMAFGGGGFALSLPAAAELSRVVDGGCLGRYNHFYGSDQRVHACLSELGVPLTREPGFHQVDIRGDPYGMLAAHPVAPLVSLHHLDYVKPMSPRARTRLEALSSLVRASRSDPARTLQQTICYNSRLNWSVSVSWGYTAQVYPRLVSPRDLETPVQTFRTWKTRQTGPFTFKTRPMPADPCERPLVFFLDRVRGGEKGDETVTEYSRYEAGKGEVLCNRTGFVAGSKVEVVKVFAPKMDPRDWRKAPRRQCCETRRAWRGNSMEVRVRKCRPREAMSLP